MYADCNKADLAKLANLCSSGNYKEIPFPEELRYMSVDQHDDLQFILNEQPISEDDNSYADFAHETLSSPC